MIFFEDYRRKYTKLVPHDDELYNVFLVIDHQSFQIDMGGPTDRERAEWHRDQLTHALIRFKES